MIYEAMLHFMEPFSRFYKYSTQPPTFCNETLLLLLLKNPPKSEKSLSVILMKMSKIFCRNSHSTHFGVHMLYVQTTLIA